MSDFIKLIEVLEEETKQYKKLHALLVKECELLTVHNFDELLVNTSKKLSVANFLPKLNEKRLFIISKIEKNYPDEKPLTLKKLTGIVPTDLKKRYTDCRTELLELTAKVQEKHIYTREYASLSFSRIRALRNKIFKCISGEVTYNHKGRMPDKATFRGSSREA